MLTDSDYDDSSISQSVLPDMLLDSNKSVKSYLDSDNLVNLVNKFKKDIHQLSNEMNKDSNG